MPIYEFYCCHCHIIYSFLAKSANNAKIPRCPRCQAPLERRMSVFAAISPGKNKDAAAKDPFAGLNEKKVANELEKLVREADKIRDDDHRAAAQLMKKFSSITGMKLGEGFDEALKRMEKGEDPEAISADLGDVLTAEEPLTAKKRGKIRDKKKIKIDETLYEL